GWAVPGRDLSGDGLRARHQGLRGDGDGRPELDHRGGGVRADPGRRRGADHELFRPGLGRPGRLSVPGGDAGVLPHRHLRRRPRAGMKARLIVVALLIILLALVPALLYWIGGGYW